MNFEIVRPKLLRRVPAPSESLPSSVRARRAPPIAKFSCEDRSGGSGERCASGRGDRSLVMASLSRGEVWLEVGGEEWGEGELDRLESRRSVAVCVCVCACVRLNSSRGALGTCLPDGVRLCEANGGIVGALSGRFTTVPLYLRRPNSTVVLTVMSSCAGADSG